MLTRAKHDRFILHSDERGANRVHGTLSLFYSVLTGDRAGTPARSALRVFFPPLHSHLLTGDYYKRGIGGIFSYFHASSPDVS
jgi:hypothetical protein